EFSDCRVNDARLVVLNARSAADLGATVRPRHRVTGPAPSGHRWPVAGEDRAAGKAETVEARALGHGGGPWADAGLAGAFGRNDADNIRLVQGSHIVIARKFEHDSAYFFQNSYGRIFFAIPYEEDFTLIGTTDRDYEGDPGEVAITPDEI